MPVPTGMSISLVELYSYISTNIITTLFISSAMMATMSTMVPTTVVVSFNNS